MSFIIILTTFLGPAWIFPWDKSSDQFPQTTHPITAPVTLPQPEPIVMLSPAEGNGQGASLRFPASM
jgi:hypothetical protein